jgi:hypothetical protein
MNLKIYNLNRTNSKQKNIRIPYCPVNGGDIQNSKFPDSDFVPMFGDLMRTLISSEKLHL